MHDNRDVVTRRQWVYRGKNKERYEEKEKGGTYTLTSKGAREGTVKGGGGGGGGGVWAVW